MRELAKVWPHPTRQANADIQMVSPIDIIVLSPMFICPEIIHRLRAMSVIVSHHLDAGFSNRPVFGKNPIQCIIQIPKDADALFAHRVAQLLKHVRQSKFQVTIHQDGAA